MVDYGDLLAHLAAAVPADQAGRLVETVAASGSCAAMAMLAARSEVAVDERVRLVELAFATSPGDAADGLTPLAGQLPAELQLALAHHVPPKYFGRLLAQTRSMPVLETVTVRAVTSEEGLLCLRDAFDEVKAFFDAERPGVFTTLWRTYQGTSRHDLRLVLLQVLQRYGRLDPHRMRSALAAAEDDIVARFTGEQWLDGPLLDRAFTHLCRQMAAQSEDTDELAPYALYDGREQWTPQQLRTLSEVVADLPEGSLDQLMIRVGSWLQSLTVSTVTDDEQWLADRLPSGEAELVWLGETLSRRVLVAVLARPDLTTEQAGRLVAGAGSHMLGPWLDARPGDADAAAALLALNPDWLPECQDKDMLTAAAEKALDTAGSIPSAEFLKAGLASVIGDRLWGLSWAALSVWAAADPQVAGLLGGWLGDRLTDPVWASGLATAVSDEEGARRPAAEVVASVSAAVAQTSPAASAE